MVSNVSFMLPKDVSLADFRTGVRFDASQVNSFVPFEHGKAIFGGFFGDEGKGLRGGKKTS